MWTTVARCNGAFAKTSTGTFVCSVSKPIYVPLPAKLLRPAERLQILFKYLIGRRASRKPEDFDFVWIFDRRRVLCREIRNYFGAQVAMMTGVAGYRTHSFEVGPVDFVHHLHHSA